MITECCQNCFTDKILITKITSTADKKGICSSCNLHADNIIPITDNELQDYFSNLMGTYIEDAEGISIGSLIQNDWKIFSEKLDDIKKTLMVSAILEDANVTFRKYSHTNKKINNPLKTWETLQQEIRHENRFFIKSSFDKDYLKNLLEQIISDNKKTEWFRARISSEKIEFDIKDMGAPPKELTTSGRANPPGIAYLYMASDAETAISEVRPHPGEHISLAKFTIAEDLKLIDLVEPRSIASPFYPDSASGIEKLRDDLILLEKLGHELTRPITPKAAVIEYIPSQYLCEAIKEQGFDGVIYKSSLGKGINLALFYPEKATPTFVSHHNVRKVNIDFV